MLAAYSNLVRQQMADRAILLGNPNLDIKKLSLIVKQSCDISVTREIDTNKISLPLQQIISLLSMGDSRRAIVNESGVLNHVYLTFVFFVDDDELRELFNTGCLQYSIHDTIKKSVNFVWATGNILQFKQFTITASNNETLVELANNVYNQLNNNGLRDLFTGCRIMKNGNGQLVIEE